MLLAWLSCDVKRAPEWLLAVLGYGGVYIRVCERPQSDPLMDSVPLLADLQGHSAVGVGTFGLGPGLRLT